MRLDLKKLKTFIKNQTKIRIDLILSVIIFFCLGIFITTSSFTLWPLYRIKENINYLFSQEKPIYVEFNGLKNNLLLEVFNKIRFSYLPLKELPDERTLTKQATLGLIKSLKDPYTYLEEIQSPHDLKVVGIMLDYNSNGIVGIREISKESSAFKEGLRQNDLIIRIGRQNVVGKDIKEIKAQIKNSPDTFEITVYQLEKNQLLTTKISKKEPEIENNISLSNLDSTNLYILKIHSFTPTSASEFFEEIEKNDLAKIQGLIIDLRDNTGGDTRAVRKIIETFLEQDQIIMSEETRNGEKTFFKSTGSKHPELIKMPKVILVNNLSASSSEIFTLALKSNQNIPIIGEKTYGKGLITEELQVSTQDILTLTVAKWFGPKGEFIDKVGINPDYPETEDILKQAENILKNQAEK